MQDSLFSRILKSFFIFFAFLIIVVFLLYYVREANIIGNWKSSGIIHSHVHINPDSNLVFVQVDTSDFPSRPYPDSGDVITMLDDSLASWGNWYRYFHQPNIPDQQYSISFVHKDDTLKTVIQTSPVRIWDFAVLSFITILRFLIALSYLGVGLWAYFKRPDSEGVKVLVLFCFAMAGFTIFSVHMGLEGYATISVPFLHLLTNILGGFGIFFGAFWLNLQLLFPKPGKFIRSRPTLAYLLCYVPISLALIFTIFAGLRGWHWAGFILIGVLMIQIVSGLIILGRSYLTTTELLEKRQTRLVLWGTGAGLSGLVFSFLLAIVARPWIMRIPETYLLGFVGLIFLVLLLSPLSFAYSFGRYRLLEVEGKIRRGTRYVYTTIILLFGFYIAIYLLSGLLLSSLGIESRGIVLLVVLLLAIGFTPAQRKIQSFTENRIYPERNRLKSMLNDFLRQSLLITDKKPFWTELEKRFKDVLKVDLVYAVLKSEKKSALTHWSGEMTPFATEGEFVKELVRLENKPVMMDEALVSEKIHPADEEKEWLDKNKIALILPLVTHSNMIGFVAISYKSAHKDFETKDIEILKSLSSQVAIAAENILLLEENLEKRRLEDELIRARKIQEGLLPRHIPKTPGLSVAAKSRFCLEVAGDYYDVINLDDTRTVFAVGDVSGKGAAAALLMSNLQASFRTMVGVGIKLSDMLGRINDLIFANTPPDQFITFFVGIYDRKNSSLIYVNAGHNLPLVIRNEGRIEELDKGGLILGVIPGTPYEQGFIELNPGNLLFLYTDGVTEALNSTEEMFGEKRVKEFLLNNINDSPEKVLENLKLEVERFTENAPLEDDFTLLAVRALE